MLSGHPVPTGKHHGHSRRTPLLIPSGLHCQSDSQTHRLNELAGRLFAEALRLSGMLGVAGAKRLGPPFAGIRGPWRLGFETERSLYGAHHIPKSFLFSFPPIVFK